jgi:hypothetical protein
MGFRVDLLGAGSAAVQALGPTSGSIWREPVGSCSLRGLGALFAGIQELEEAGGEIPLFAQALGHAGRHERPGRDPPEHVVVPREQLAQLGADVGLRELWRHRARANRIQSARQCHEEYWP